MCLGSYDSAQIKGLPRRDRRPLPKSGRHRLSFPLHGLMVSRYRGESASPLHLRDRNLTCTMFKLSKTSRSSSSISDYESHFGGTGRSYSCRNASTGSRREARTAGYNPKINPTAADTPNDMAIEFHVTNV